MVAKLVLHKNTNTAWDLILGTIPNGKCYESENHSAVSDSATPWLQILVGILQARILE